MVFVREGEVAMATDQQVWLKEYAVTCRVFKGRWSIRHCLKMYDDIKDLRIRMSSRSKGKVTRHESTYNPCEHCAILANYLQECRDEANEYGQPTGPRQNEAWAV